jgi:riboflavin biosynthesis pyrimidine reductase
LLRPAETFHHFKTHVLLIVFNQSQLQEVLNELGKRGILQLMIEGGGAVHSSLLALNLADELVVYHGPKLLGESANAHEINNWPGITLAPTISLADSWKLRELRKIGDDGDYVVFYERPVEHKQANGN